MFTIDLLLGKAKPPRSHPLLAAGATVAFAIVIVALAFDGVYYYSCSRQLAAERQAMARLENKIIGLADVARTLVAADKRRAEVDASLEEVRTALDIHRQWSDILVALTRTAPETITIGDIMTKRDEVKGKYEYSMMMGVISPTGPVAVEQFVRDLRAALPLASGPDNIRIISQRQQQVEGRDFQYYVVQCRLKP
jgi:hypothetical protein